MKKLLFLFFIIFTSSLSTFAMTYDEASTQNKPIVILFYMDGCSACMEYKPIFRNYASKYSYKYNFVEENIHNSIIASAFSLATVPAVGIINPVKNQGFKLDNQCMWDQNCVEANLNKYSP